MADDLITVTNADTGESIQVPRDVYSQTTGEDDFLSGGADPLATNDFLGANEDLTIEEPEPSFLSGVMKTYENIPSGISYLGDKVSQAYHKSADDIVLDNGITLPGGGVLGGVLGIPSNMISGVAQDMGASGVARAATEGGVMGATSMIPGVGLVLAPGAGAITSLGIDALSGNADFSMNNLKERMGEYYALPLASTAVRSGLGAVTKGAGKVVRKYNANKVAAENRFAELGEADALALRVDRSATPAQTVIAREVAEAAPEVGKTGLWDGGDTFNLKTKKFERYPNSTKPTDMAQIEKNLIGDGTPENPGALKQIVEERNSVIKTLDEASKPSGGGATQIGLTKPSELPLKEFQEISDRLKKSVFTKEEARYFDDIAGEVVDDFNKTEGRQFLKGVYAEDIPFSKQVANNTGLSIGSLHDYLQNIYATQRALKRYDVSRAAAGDANPSALARAGAEIKALDVLAGKVRSLLDTKSQEIIATRGLDISPTHLNELNSAYSSLKTIADHGIKPFIQQVRKSLDGLSKELPPDASLMYAAKRGKDMLMEKVYPPSMKFKATGDDAIKALQKATALRANPAGVPDAPTFVRIPRSPVALTAAISGGLIPPEIQESPAFQKTMRAQSSTEENATRAIADFHVEEPEMASQIFADSKYRGYSVVQGEDGADYLYDPNQVVAFAEKIKREESSVVARAKRLVELNRSNKVVDADLVKLPKEQEPKLKTTKTMGGERQDDPY